MPGDENGVKSKRGATGEESAKKKKKTEKIVRIYSLETKGLFVNLLVTGRHGQTRRRPPETR